MQNQKGMEGLKTQHEGRLRSLVLQGMLVVQGRGLVILQRWKAFCPTAIVFPYGFCFVSRLRRSMGAILA